MSVEVDVLPIAESNASTAELADLIEGAAGEWSLPEEQHGFSIDGVDLDTVVLPAGWRIGWSGPEREHGGAVGTAAVHRLVWTLMTCAWRSCAPIERRTSTSCEHCTMPGWWMPS